MMNRRTGQLGRDIGKRRCAWGFRNHYGWWWIGAFMLRSCDALIATSCGAPALMIARFGPARWAPTGTAAFGCAAAAPG
jgi:hypothetical protein